MRDASPAQELFAAVLALGLVAYCLLTGRIPLRFGDPADQVGRDDDFQLHLGHEIHRVFGPAVDFGLAAYAFTNASDKAAALSERLEAGWIGINSFTPALADAPLGGMKDSGVGYEGGPEGLDAYQQIRFLSHDRAYPSGR